MKQGIGLLLLLIGASVAQFTYKGDTYKFIKVEEFEKATITEYYNTEDDLCRRWGMNVNASWVQLPGFYVASTPLLFITYGLTLFYLFLGIAIVSDVFMG